MLGCSESPSVAAKSQASVPTVGSLYAETVAFLAHYQPRRYRQISTAGIYETLLAAVDDAPVTVSGLGIHWTNMRSDLAARQNRFAYLAHRFPNVGALLDSGLLAAPTELTPSGFRTYLNSLSDSPSGTHGGLALAGSVFSPQPGLTVELGDTANGQRACVLRVAGRKRYLIVYPGAGAAPSKSRSGKGVADFMWSEDDWRGFTEAPNYITKFAADERPAGTVAKNDPVATNNGPFDFFADNPMNFPPKMQSANAKQMLELADYVWQKAAAEAARQPPECQDDQL